MKYIAAIVNARGKSKNAGIGRGAVPMMIATMMIDTKKTTTERQSASLTIGSNLMHLSPKHHRGERPHSDCSIHLLSSCSIPGGRRGAVLKYVECKTASRLRV